MDLMPHLHLSLSTITFEMAISTTTTKVTLWMLLWGQFHVTFQMVIILDTWINHTNLSLSERSLNSNHLKQPIGRDDVWVTVDVKYAVYSPKLT